MEMISRSEVGVAVRRLKEALDWIDAAFVGEPDDSRTWPTLEPLAPHAFAVVSHAAAANIAEPTGRLLNALGVFYYARGEFARAEPLLRQLLETAERRSGPAQTDTLLIMHNLAACLQAMGELEESERLYRRVLAARERMLGPEHRHDRGSA